ncbi:ABC transporter ATP-binding protein [Paenibacillus sp. IB182496]|uniref:ABC transporter ATP-binding protein n=1 Tax=Paenibacillus sabuli TaxID=2772509 RepID=A0A927GRV2_9BACL|nr:ABC transporter ATP-binding protein [Paenibacillus sabuli]
MVEARELTYQYAGRVEPTLGGLTLRIARGEIFGLLGPSGSGKSTLLNVLTGRLKRYTGTVNVLGWEAAAAGPGFYERIGVGFESPGFYERFTALDNLRHFRRLYSSSATDPERLLRELGLAESAQLKAEQLSKGMRMRLGVCRALLGDPQLLLLDEPTSGLDPKSEERLRQVLEGRRAAGMTIVLTTHNMKAAVQLCDRIGFLVDGRMQLIDTPQAVMQRYGERILRVEHAESEDGACQVERFALDGIGANARFQQLLQSGRIMAMHTEEATLEQVFGSIAGRVIQ